VTRLESLGWNPFFERQLNPTLDRDIHPARVIEEQRGSWDLAWEGGVCRASVAGRLRHRAQGDASLLPCVGDWVTATFPAGTSRDGAVIHRVLERRTRFSRQAAGERTEQQIVAANVDTVFLVQSMNRNLNVRRLERYLALLWESGAEPVIVLSKSDLCEDAEAARAEMTQAAAGATVLVVTALVPDGLDPLLPYLAPGRTAALVGSSGVGKSTIVNRLAGEELMDVQSIREDDRGLHTTTFRRIVPLPTGGMLLDTPGMRTVLLWEGEEGLSQTFEDVESVATRCRFSDCQHETEPGCAVRAGLEDGSLDSGRYESYLKLRREVRYQARKNDQRLRIAEQNRWKRIHREMRRRPDKRTM